MDVMQFTQALSRIWVLETRLLDKSKVERMLEANSADEVLKYFTSVMRGEEKDQFGLDASLKDRNFAAKCLAQRHGLLIEKKEISGGCAVELVDDVNE